MSEYIVILDYGTEYTQLIARRIRELKVYCEIHQPGVELAYLISKKPKGIILSGGASSVYAQNAPKAEKKLFNLGIPVLGIGYGMELMSHVLGGEILKSQRGEYCSTRIKITKDNPLLKEIPKEINVWMSHGDEIYRLPKGFIQLGKSKNSVNTIIAEIKRNLYGVQFPPEVIHSQYGIKIIRNFLFDICQCHGDWSMSSFIVRAIEEIRQQVDKKGVICAVSGGVDSTVTAVLVHEAVGNQLRGIFVNNGLLRKNEQERVLSTFRNNFGIRLDYINAEKEFLEKLKNVIEPEKKRKIIGEQFIRLFEKKAQRIKDAEFLAQGTLYPDVIESRATGSGIIKTHHNVGGLPKKMKFKLIEPLKELFKDEVRLLGKELGIADELLWRHPFPGPGLAVRIIGEVTKKKLDILREADDIVMEEIKLANWYSKLWQSFAVLLPVRTVGMMGDKRTYANVIALRAVTSEDAMTAAWAKLPYDLLGKISSRIIDEVRGVNRVVYDISCKPPSTIEWE